MKLLNMKLILGILIFASVTTTSSPVFADVNSSMVSFITESIEQTDAGLAIAAKTNDISAIKDNTWLRLLCSFSVKYFILGVTLQPEVELHW